MTRWGAISQRPSAPLPQPLLETEERLIDGCVGHKRDAEPRRELCRPNFTVRGDI
jgi:hypothetical protein